MQRHEFLKMPVMFGSSEYFRTDGIDTLVMRNGKKKTSTVPLVVDGVDVSIIGSTAYNYSDIETVIIPEGIVEIQ